MAILVIEQNIGVATTVSENVAIMVNGRINHIVESRRLAADRELQQRLLGVGRHSDAAEPDLPGGRKRIRASARKCDEAVCRADPDLRLQPGAPHTVVAT